jgi:hypothetical protein
MNVSALRSCLAATLIGCSPAPGPTAPADPPPDQPTQNDTSAEPTPTPEPTVAPTAAPTTTASGAAPKACTEIGCRSGFTIPIVWDNALSPAKYKVELTVDGKKGQCEVRWPYKSCTEAAAVSCSGDVAFRLVTACKANEPPATGMVLGPIELDNTPEKVSLKIWRDKIMTYQRELTPTYKESRPNGPGCEPLCKQASVEVCVGICERHPLPSFKP